MQDDIFHVLDAEFERDYALETPWHAVLTESELYPSNEGGGAGPGATHGAAARATLLDAVLGSDNEDSDFECVINLSVSQRYHKAAT